MDYVEHPSKQNCARFQARVADVLADVSKKKRQSLTANEPFDLAAAVAERWKQQREPQPLDPPVHSGPTQSLILDTGY